MKTVRQLMGYSGAVSREHSSGERIRRGPISKAGNAHLRRIVVEQPGPIGTARRSARHWRAGSVAAAKR